MSMVMRKEWIRRGMDDPVYLNEEDSDFKI
jgi:hypothetical protein